MGPPWPGGLWILSLQRPLIPFPAGSPLFCIQQLFIAYLLCARHCCRHRAKQEMRGFPDLTDLGSSEGRQTIAHAHTHSRLVPEREKCGEISGCGSEGLAESIVHSEKLD